MSELQDKLNQILSNPEALAQVQSLGEQLGLTKKSETPQTAHSSAPPSAPPSAPHQPVSAQAPFEGILSGDMMNTIARIAPLMSSIKQDDNTTRLLNALRPFLSEEKQQRLDKAEKMLRILKIMPLIKTSGLF